MKQKEFRERLAAETKSAAPHGKSSRVSETAEPQQPEQKANTAPTSSVAYVSAKKVSPPKVGNDVSSVTEGNTPMAEETTLVTESSPVIEGDNPFKQDQLDNPFKPDQIDNPEPEVELLVSI